jgi:site-specific DNA-methyltransferase (adenine-specific)
MEGRSDRQEFDGNPAHSLGRWPANVVLDESQAAELDAQTGVLTSGSWDGRRNGQKTTGILGEFESRSEAPRVGDSGGASRFFPTFRYEAKAPTAERPRYKREGGSDNATTYGQMKKRECNVCGNRTCPAGGDQSGKPWPTCGHNDWSWVEQQSARDEFVSHPTVKPLSLMRWLVRLVTPPGGTVLEPFAGSGTTVEACIVEGFACIAIEKGDEYLPLIMQRIHRRRDPVAAIRQTGDELGLFELDGEGA